MKNLKAKGVCAPNQNELVSILKTEQFTLTNNMKSICGLLTLTIALVLTGCSTTARTISQQDESAANTATAQSKNVTPSAGGGHITNTIPVLIHYHPTYDLPIAQVWPIVQSTLSKFCDGKMKVADATHYRLEAKNQNVMAGDTYLTVNLRSDQQRTVVDVSVRDYGFNRAIGTRSPHILDLFLERLDTAMNKVKSSAPDITTRLQTLNDLKAKGLITEEEYQQKRAAILNGL